MKNLKQLLGLCEHTWEFVKAINVFRKSDPTTTTSIIYLNRCKKCGEIKTKKIKG